MCCDVTVSLHQDTFQVCRVALTMTQRTRELTTPTLAVDHDTLGDVGQVLGDQLLDDGGALSDFVQHRCGASHLIS